MLEVIDPSHILGPGPMQREYTINIMKLLSFPCNAADQIKVYLQFTIIVLQFELTKINSYTMVQYPSEKLKLHVN